MAEKSFGVKEVNLIGASGTPSITSPNNINLNAVNVAISTNVSIGGTLTVSGNISIGGTLTYEDVTNIDSIGIVTAREGIKIPDSKIARFGTDNDASIYHNGLHLFIKEEDGGIIFIDGANGVSIQRNGSAKIATQSDGAFVTGNFGASGTITSAGVNITGVVTATSFSGSGANLTSLPAANLTGTLPAISGASLTGIAVTEAPVVDYTVTADGGSNYYFHGGGVDETDGNPDLYLVRGQKYRFNNTTGSGHPFEFRVSSGGSAYSNGVSGDDEGVQFFTVPYDAPSSIVYQCTLHGGMVGNIYIGGGSGSNGGIPVFLAYRVSNYNLTSTESALVYDSEKIDVGGNYNTSNGRFTAPVTGLYEFGYASIASNVNTVYRYTLKVNGSDPYNPLRLELRLHQASSEFGTNGEFVAYVNMTAGQYAQIYAKSDTGVNNVYGDTSYGYTYFRGRLIG